jgi:hypothetical protein
LNEGKEKERKTKYSTFNAGTTSRGIYGTAVSSDDDKLSPVE